MGFQPSPNLALILRNLLLIILSLVLLPASIGVLIFSYANQIWQFTKSIGRQDRKPAISSRKTVLISGVSTPKGLKLARMFKTAGHRVIGADFESSNIATCARFSHSLSKFYRLALPDEKHGASTYIASVLGIVKSEKVSIWVPLSDLVSASDDALAKEVLARKTLCKTVQFDGESTSLLEDNYRFMRHTEGLGLEIPETHRVTSRGAAHKILHGVYSWSEPDSPVSSTPSTIHRYLEKSMAHAHGSVVGPQKEYLLKPIGVKNNGPGHFTILPGPTVSSTYNHLSGIKIAVDHPWILQEFIQGEEYCSHALVVDGEVKIFAAYPTVAVKNRMRYEALSATDPLSKAMLYFTSEFASRTQDRNRSEDSDHSDSEDSHHFKDVTGHLAFIFRVKEVVTNHGVERLIYPMQCAPRADIGLTLFNNLSAEAISKAYMSICSPGTRSMEGTNGKQSNGHGKQISGAIVLIQPKSVPVYFVGDYFAYLVLFPLIALLCFKLSISAFALSVLSFFQSVLYLQEGLFEVWDPLPAFWLYHIYWPFQFVLSIMQQTQWTGINFSTNEMTTQ